MYLTVNSYPHELDTCFNKLYIVEPHSTSALLYKKFTLQMAIHKNFVSYDKLKFIV